MFKRRRTATKLREASTEAKLAAIALVRGITLAAARVDESVQRAMRGKLMRLSAADREALESMRQQGATSPHNWRRPR
jgi:hypothetical protein